MHFCDEFSRSLFLFLSRSIIQQLHPRLVLHRYVALSYLSVNKDKSRLRKMPSLKRSNDEQLGFSRQKRHGLVQIASIRILLLLIIIMVLHMMNLGSRISSTQAVCSDDSKVSKSELKSASKPAMLRHYVESFGVSGDSNLIATPKQAERLGGEESTRHTKFVKALNALKDEELFEEVDPLFQDLDWKSQSRIDIYPKVKYLGVLVDGGRHHFSLKWLKRLIIYLHRLRYNMIHLRLTDDQAFHLKLDSYPQLAMPAHQQSGTKDQLYTPDELRGLVEYAKLFNITIIPEINVPGHAGAWAGVPGLIVGCPHFICEKGYGIPLNATHPEMKNILKGVISEVIDIFDPPFLHLGGDEVTMSQGCFRELNIEPFDYLKIFEPKLKEVLHEIGYSEDQVVRWEETSQLHGASTKDLLKSIHLKGAGTITHYWHDRPGTKTNKDGQIIWDEPPKKPFFVSRGLYMDVDHDSGAFDLYNHSFHDLQLEKGPGYFPTAIIGGTFELSQDNWKQRNIATRLIAIAMGAAQLEFSSPEDFSKAFQRICHEKLGLHPVLCDLEGFLAVPYYKYKRDWGVTWSEWKNGMCSRLTDSNQERRYMDMGPNQRLTLADGNKHFWQSYRQPIEDTKRKYDVPVLDKVDPKMKTGVILDLSNSMQTVERLYQILNKTISPLAIDLMQLRLADNYAFAVGLEHLQLVGYSPFGEESKPLVNTEELKAFVHLAHEMKVEVFPEMSVSTDAGGWIGAGFLAQCPDLFCKDEGTLGMAVADIGQAAYLPVLYSAIRELREAFSASQYFHLGSDERAVGAKCFQEDKRYSTLPFADFESNLTIIAEESIGMSRQHLIRWENQEKKRYPDRTGDITHYRSTRPFTIPEIRKEEPFFLTIDLLASVSTPETSGPSLFYEIYSNTRALAGLYPEAIFAEVRLLDEESWSEYRIDLRLLSFRLGTSSEEYSLEDFKEQLARKCRESNFDHCEEANSGSRTLDKELEYAVESSVFQDAVCKHYTHFKIVRVMKPERMVL